MHIITQKKIFIYAVNHKENLLAYHFRSVLQKMEEIVESPDTTAETSKKPNLNGKYNKQWSNIADDHPVPKDVPPLTELKMILPNHCFQPDLKTSFYFVLKDLSFACALYVSMRLIELQPYSVLTNIYRPIYWLLQGTMFWAFFVLAHDCGHGSFSKYSMINDITGTFLNAIILVPYYPWKLSHKHHHKGTGNIDKDEIFYPIRKSQQVPNPWPHIPFFGLGAGWWGYLVWGFTPRYKHHFNPFDPLFKGHVFGCSCSIVSLGMMSLLLVKYYEYLGLIALISHYVIPGKYQQNNALLTEF